MIEWLECDDWLVDGRHTLVVTTKQTLSTNGLLSRYVEGMQQIPFTIYPTVDPTKTKTLVNWEVSSIRAGRTTGLSVLASSNSGGRRTWSKTGSCTLTPISKPTALRMGSTGSCTLTLTIAKSGKYPAKTSTKKITIT